jgi:hypothetical protein
MKVVQEIIFPDGGRVVRYDPPMTARGLIENLVCFNVDGSLRWKKAPSHPGTEVNFFTGVGMEEDRLIANTWGSYKMAIDPQTGAESKAVSTK